MVFEDWCQPLFTSIFEHATRVSCHLSGQLHGLSGYVPRCPGPSADGLLRVTWRDISTKTT